MVAGAIRRKNDFVGPGDILILLADIDAKLLSDGLKPRQGD